MSGMRACLSKKRTCQRSLPAAGKIAALSLWVVKRYFCLWNRLPFDFAGGCFAHGLRLKFCFPTEAFRTVRVQECPPMHNSAEVLVKMENLLPLCVCALSLALLAVLGCAEKRRNEANRKKLRVAVNVNGIRGKSTATRLITAILAEAGYRVVGKTTGTAARMIFWDAEDEQEVVRRPHGISISEQIQVINSAVKRGADALVCECMAVRPDYQRVYQHQIINAGLTVITNVLEDHLDEMGPTTDQIAWAFADTIPYNGAVVIPDCEYTEYFKNVAEERGTRVFVADDSLISEEYLKQFDYRLFPHNCSVALAAADALGIDRETALSAMLKAHTDPGALRFYDISLPKGDCCIVNAFAANEPSSSLDIWNIICSERPEQSANPIILMNCRPDRVDRTKQFVRDFFPKIPNAVIIAAGESTGNITKAEAHGRFPNADRYINLEKQSPEKVLETLKPLLPGRIVMCVGNIHGSGEPILHALLEYGRLPLPEPIFRDRRKSRH